MMRAVCDGCETRIEIRGEFGEFPEQQEVTNRLRALGWGTDERPDPEDSVALDTLDLCPRCDRQRVRDAVAGIRTGRRTE